MFQQLWIIHTRERPQKKFVTLAIDREDAKRKAKMRLGTHGGPTPENPDTFVCQPITNPNDEVVIELQLEL